MSQYLTAYLVTAMVFLAIDAIWLSNVARRFYYPRLGDMLLNKPRLGAAAVFYAVYVIGIVIFAVMPGVQAGSIAKAGGLGALFGFFAYATYDMTNYATLRKWPLSIVLVDTAWGTVLTGASATAGYLGVTLLGVP